MEPNVAALNSTCPVCARPVGVKCWTVSGHTTLATPHQRRLDWGTGYVAGYTAATPVTPAAPADAIWIHPSGNDGNPGTESKPRATPMQGKTNVMLGGTYNGFRFFATQPGTIMSAPGATVVWEGNGAPNAITAGALLNLRGTLIAQNYSPTSKENGSNAVVYFGGNVGGSEIDGLVISKSKQAGLGFQVPLKITNLTVADSGYSGVLGTTADGTTFGSVKVLRSNRGGNAQDGQLGSIKMTRSKDLRFTKGVYIEDPGGGEGLWTDVSCRNPVATGVTVKGGSVGIHYEETEGGIIAGSTVTDATFGLTLLATGHVRVWGNTVSGASVAMSIQQDRLKNEGTYPPNLTQEQAPWWAVGNEIGANVLAATVGYKIAFMAYADGPAKGMLVGTDMFQSLKNTSYAGSVQLGRKDGGRDTVSAATYTGTPTIPADIAALLK